MTLTTPIGVADHGYNLILVDAQGARLYTRAELEEVAHCVNFHADLVAMLKRVLTELDNPELGEAWLMEEGGELLTDIEDLVTTVKGGHDG